MIDRILAWCGAALVAVGFIVYFAVGRVVLSCSALEQQFSDDVTRATQLGNELNLRLQRGLTATDRDALDTGIALGERVEAETDQLLNRGCDQKLEASATANRPTVETNLSLMRRYRDDLH
jgi:hypothetical protein